MKKACFSTMINAPKEKVWQVLWDEQTYGTWTAAFGENSRAISDWQEGSKILFVAGNGGGMHSVIDKKTAPDFISFKHLGEVKNGQELPPDEKTRSWAGALENYTLTQIGNTTELAVEMDISEDQHAYFAERFLQALEKVKELAEA
ncbi:SRPBCC domain-containing protein [Hymenobacter sp. BT635]|uniref:SRPBCC domain-containing protein n=1 Tax=Hymenobacter nitidus TaxID=2880929 RepID=A0ABS8AEF4_9BACT|nr:SRPBCC domain-containing protein [Hymenobacter nitidus]MCB2377600.1 SRPBCC domain-containing protein [Hymenobacter nitidus]